MTTVVTSSFWLTPSLLAAEGGKRRHGEAMLRMDGAPRL